MANITNLKAWLVISIFLVVPGLSTPALAKPETVLAYDDGTGEIYVEVHTTQYLRQRFLVSDFGLSGDYLIKTVRICWWRHGLEDFTGVIKLRDRQTGNLVPAASFSNPAEGWQDYDVSGSDFVSDDFYVELWQTAGYGYIHADTHEPHYGMSEFSTNSGANWHVSALEMDSMVRALVVPGVRPEKAYNPDPPDGAQIIATNVTLNWAAGFGAASHNVYFSVSNQAVINGTAPVTHVTEAHYGPLSLDLDKTYYWRVDEFDGSATHKGDVWSFTVYSIENVEDFETGDFSKFPWKRYGDERWAVTSRQKHSGTYSAKADELEHDQSATLQVTLDCGSGNISFYRKVSSELVFDRLKFYIDGAEKGKWSGEEDWAQVSFGVTAGTRTFEWTYSKDSSESEGDDAAWIDDVVFPIPIGPYPPPPAGVIELTDATFDQIVLGSDVPVLVFFYADWYPYSRMMEPIIEEIADKYAGRARICKLNFDDARDTAIEFSVSAIPTLILFKDCQVQRKWVGVTSKGALAAAIDELL